tara:strand:+ start:1456 stop:5859 length:4404 start_codon:yes stop_codon:yes gene_type:complete
MAQETQDKQKPALWRRLALWALIGGTVLFGLASAAVLYLDSAAGQRRLVAWIEAETAGGPAAVQVSGLKGSLLGRLRVDKVTVSDARGLWAEARDIRVAWRPWALIRKRLSVSEVTAGAVRLHRLPETVPEQAGTAPSAPLAVPELPVDIVLDRFRLAEIDLGAALLGRAERFHSAGRLNILREQDLDVSFLLGRLQGDGDRLSLDIAYQENRRHLHLDGIMKAPRGGVFAKILGRDDLPDLELRLNGDGPLRDWSGTLLAQTENDVLGQADIFYKNRVFSLTSGFDLDRFLGTDLAQKTGHRLDLALELRPSEDVQGRELEFRLETDVLNFRIMGPVRRTDLLQFHDLQVRLDLTERFVLGRGSEALSIKPARLSGRLTGSLETPRFRFNIPALDLTQGEQLSLATSLSGTLAGEAAQISYDLSGAVTTVGGKVLASLKPLLGPAVNWRLAGRYDPAHLRLAAEIIRLDGKLLNLHGGGDMTGAGDIFTGRVDLRLNNLRPLVPAAAGALRAAVDIYRNGVDEPVRLSLEAASENLNFDDAVLRQIVGPAVTLNSRLTVSPAGDVTLENLDLNARHVTAQAELAIKGEAQAVQGTYQIALRDLEQANLPGGLRFKGGLAMSGTFDGTILAPALSMRSRLGALDLQGVSFEDVVVAARAESLLSVPRLRLDLSGGSALGPLRGHLQIEGAPKGGMKVPEFIVTMGMFRAEGQFERRSAAAPVLGRLRLNLVEGGEIPADRPVLDAEHLEMTALFSAAGAARTEDQKIDISGQIGRLRHVLPGGDLFLLERGMLEGRMVFGPSGPAITASGRLENLSHPRLELSRLSLELKQEHQAIRYHVSARGTPALPMDLVLDGQVAPGLENEWRLMAEIFGTLNEQPLLFQNPLVFSWKGENMALQPLAVQFGKGQLITAFTKTAQLLDTRLEAKALDLRPLHRFFPDMPLSGVINGRLEFSATPDRSTGQLKFQLHDLTSPQHLFAVDPALHLDFEGRLRDRRITLESRLELPETFRTTLSVRLPGLFDFTQLKLDIPDDQPLQGRVSLSGDVGAVWPVLNLYHHDVSGRVDGQFALSGSLDEPEVSGRVEMKKGRYENTQIGFVAQDISLQAEMQDRQLKIRDLRATDGAAGRIRAAGTVQILEDYRYDLALALKAEQTRIVRQPTLELMASADLALRKTGRDIRLNGEVTVDRGDISLALRGSSDIIEADVIEINGTGEAQALQDAGRRRLGPLLLDVDLKAPGKIFIRGRGLDSEWRGDLDITGTSDRPVVEGSISLVRGFFDFSGKRFALSRGEITFPGDGSNDPRLDITAELALSDLVAMIHIGGRASQPDLTVTSTPELPQEEVLARILFGTSVTELSPLEALQLASSIQALSGDGGPGVVDQLRGSIGFDRLIFGSAGTADDREYGTTVSGGKYLTNNIYVEVTTSPATGAMAQSVEVELSDNLSLITRRGLDRENSLAIRWSWDY